MPAVPDSLAPLRGVIPPVTTPLTPDGDVDTASLRRLVDFVVGAGVHAVFALGSGGEGPYLVEEQARAVLETITSQVAGRVPVLAGISDIGTAKAARNARIAQEYPVDALVVTTAFYGTIGPLEAAAHLRALADVCDRPLFAYDIPGFTGSKLPAEVTIELAHEGVIQGVKDTSGDEDGFRTVLEGTRDLPGFSVITGSDITGDAAMFQGAHGMIVGVANIDPHGFVRVYDAMLAGDHATARTEQERLHALRRIAKIAAGRIGPFSATIGAFKAAQVLRGIIDCDRLQPPLQQLDDAERKAVARVLEGQHLHHL